MAFWMVPTNASIVVLNMLKCALMAVVLRKENVAMELEFVGTAPHACLMESVALTNSYAGTGAASRMRKEPAATDIDFVGARVE